jgi:hypothetical protein
MNAISFELNKQFNYFLLRQKLTIKSTITSIQSQI